MTAPAHDRPTDVGLIGYGLGGATFHAPFIAATPGLRLAAVMTSDPARRCGVLERYPDTKLVAGIDELLALSPRLELIAISSPNASHYPLARAALEAGRNVVVDKPFAVTSATPALPAPTSRCSTRSAPVSASSRRRRCCRRRPSGSARKCSPTCGPVWRVPTSS